MQQRISIVTQCSLSRNSRILELVAIAAERFKTRVTNLLRGITAVIVLIMKFWLMVKFDPEAKRWSAVFPELPGCATAGDTEAEAIANAHEALALWFEPAPIKLPKGAKMIELAVL
jgi:predicted RNase H-like HicB family nuclease